MAEAVFRSYIASNPSVSNNTAAGNNSRKPLSFRIDSAGTGAYHAGDPPDPRTLSTLRRHGIPIGEMDENEDQYGIGGYGGYDSSDGEDEAGRSGKGRGETIVCGTAEGKGAGAASSLPPYSHCARPTRDSDFTSFDYLLAMDRSNFRVLSSQRAAMARRLGQQNNRLAEVRLFGDFKPDGSTVEPPGRGEEVDDPYYGGRNGFEVVFGQCQRFSEGFARFSENRAAEGKL